LLIIININGVEKNILPVSGIEERGIGLPCLSYLIKNRSGYWLCFNYQVEVWNLLCWAHWMTPNCCRTTV